MMRCDFCNTPDPHWTCPCRDSVSIAVDERTGKHLYSQNNTGDWYACDACVKHVVAKDPRSLGAYCARQWFLKRHQPIPDEDTADFQDLLMIIEGMQKAYWDNAQGTPSLLTYN